MGPPVRATALLLGLSRLCGRGPPIIPGFDSAVWRQDSCEARMRRDAYGDTTENGFGWEVDHVLAVANGGSDDLWNLQALQWQNNRAKSDGPLRFAVTWRK